MLALDDDADLARLWALVLGRAGFDVVCTDDPAEAVRVARLRRPAVALLDLNLGWLVDGHDVGIELRRHVPSMRLVAITGDDESCMAERSAALGFDVHLVKPVPLRDLVRIVEMLTVGARR